ncbi:LOW QUALITY PROTEIN: PTR2 domain-containing protein [Cephalotus follicularis]|uniref:PTR2 domain-containing protein n=1 Tax=Cephalotus follicularis TaxID=3775 RepID=A0A1Q3BKT6_CEPFO|nr:LOW QUALITY PROTEIN: PTR2 domain-containing protein [Cephalotus follicularis]
MAEGDIYTKDGTTDFRGNPAIKEKTGTWKACPYILGNECCERLAYYGINTNLVNYLKFQLNQRSVEAVNNVTNWSGTCYVMPLIGAFLADAYLGRYWTIASFSIIYVLGMTLLTLSASVHGLVPLCDHNNVCRPTALQTAVFFVGLYLIALGTGGIKPCVSSFGADQFDDSDEAEKKKKSSFFNWFYFSINIGALFASSVLVWIQTNVGWGWGFGIPAVAMAIAVVSFFSGTRLYRNQRPGGSPFTRFFQVLVASFRKLHVEVPNDKSLLYETVDEKSTVKGSRKLDHTNQLSFFDKAAVETPSDHIKDSVIAWKLCTVTQVEELKSIIRLLPVWATGIIFSAVYSQMGTLFVLQGNTMDLHMGSSFEIPSASLSLFDTVSVIFWVPIYDSLIVPFARRLTGHKNGFTQLQRIGIGFVISVFAMLVAGTLELVRLREVKKHNYYELKHIPMSIFWQVPQYFIIGCAEVFTNIGQLEFFYEQAPDAMRSLCSALSLTTAALGNYLSTMLVTIVTDMSTRHGKPGWIPDNLNFGHLDYFFWLLTALRRICKVTMTEDDVYTKDGTVDIHKNPANKKKTGNWKSCRFILGNECCERLAYYGMSTNLVNYFKSHLNQGNVTASNNVTNWSGTCYITPLLGAFIADAYLGRYWTIAIFVMVYICGMTLLTLSASVTGLKPSCTSDGCHPTSGQIAVNFVALYLIALGTGGIKPCVSSFGADQFDETDETERQKKSSFFNWFYLSINIGALIASSVLVWIQMNVGWGWGFGIPTVAMAIAVVFFFSGSHLYRIQIPGGSPLTRIFQVIVASFRKFSVKDPDDKSLLYETADEECIIQGSRKLVHTNELSFFDKAAVVIETDRIKGLADPWRLCTVTQVEELKSIIRLLPVWASGIVFATVYSQMSTMFVLQGNTMDQHMGPHFKIPSASLSIFDTISVIFWAPVYDLFIVPFARKFTGHERGFTQLQRMGIGLVISIFSMLAAGVLEVLRLDYVKKHNYYDLENIPVSIFWQVPQYFLIGCAEVFTFIGQLEFFYAQAPDAMRSLCSALSLTTVALGNYLSTLLVTIVTKVTTENGKLGWIPDNLNRGHLDYFYWLLAILSLLNLLAYLWIAKIYTYKKTTGRAQ